MFGVDEGDAEAESNQFLRELEAWSHMTLGRIRYDYCVQTPGDLFVPMLDLHLSLLEFHKMLAN
jgi:hypothetical protein